MDRERMLARAADEVFDLLVIGGGITGAGVAREAALRGLRVALVERVDFAYGTSSRSSKLIHGGLRYLRNLEFRLVREAVVERQHLIRMAPHLVRPLPFVFPVYAGGPDPLWKLKLGLMLYDWFAGASNTIPHTICRGARLLDYEPLLNPEKLVGGAIYADSATDDSRLVLEVLMSAISAGAVASNYVEAVELKIDHQSRAIGAGVRNALNGEQFDIRATRILNAAGPWADQVRDLEDSGARPLLRLTKGVHVTVPHARLPVRHAVTMRGVDGRVMFAIPSGDFTYLGTTDTDHQGPAESAAVEWPDVSYILAAARSNFPMAQLAPDDIVSAWVGLRPLLASHTADPSAVSRGYQLFHGPSGLATVGGGKLTAFRAMASHIVDDLFPATKSKARNPRSLAPLPGAGGTRPSAEDVARLALQVDDSAAEVERVVDRYGRAFPDVLLEFRAGLPGENPRLGWLKAQVRHAVRCEMAMRLEDALRRRTSIMLFSPENGRTYVEELGAEMGRLLGWKPARLADEVTHYRRSVDDMFAWRERIDMADTRASDQKPTTVLEEGWG